MNDKYRNFIELTDNETEGRDFQVRLKRVSSSNVVIIAPHGGGIEPRTSEIAERIAAEKYSLAIFEGLKTINNRDLHITSTNFDEPRCLEIVGSSDYAIAIHGERSRGSVVFIGGLYAGLKDLITINLEQSGFVVEEHENPALQGNSPNNICNKGRLNKGVQLEVSRGLRDHLFQQSGRNDEQPLDKFVLGIQTAIEGNELLD